VSLLVYGLASLGALSVGLVLFTLTLFVVGGSDQGNHLPSSRRKAKGAPPISHYYELAVEGDLQSYESVRRDGPASYATIEELTR